jgi:hypothetical protein
VLIGLGSDDEYGDAVLSAVFNYLGIDVGETLGGMGLEFIVVKIG